MKITEFSHLKPTAKTKKSGASSSVGAFAELLGLSDTEETSAPPQLSDVAATAAMDNLLSLQEISEDDIRRKKLVLQGRNMLESLETLRRQILTGVIPAHTLLDLGRQLAMQKQSVTDPALTEIIEEIELRAAVELAKLKMAAKRPETP